MVIQRSGWIASLWWVALQCWAVCDGDPAVILQHASAAFASSGVPSFAQCRAWYTSRGLNPSFRSPRMSSFQQHLGRIRGRVDARRHTSVWRGSLGIRTMRRKQAPQARVPSGAILFVSTRPNEAAAQSTASGFGISRGAPQSPGVRAHRIAACLQLRPPIIEQLLCRGTEP